jgi:hypothetical protein
MGHAMVFNASYTGTTTVTGSEGRMHIGGSRHALQPSRQGVTTGQGSYFVNSGGVLMGVGTIGLQAGARVRVQNNGWITPDAGVAGTTKRLNINGDFAVESGGTYLCHVGGLQSDHIAVNGVLDLSAANDTLLIGGDPLTLPATFVVASYSSRLGEFANVIWSGVGPSHVLVEYTSPVGGGPGQIVVTRLLPEPGAATVGMIALASAASRRRRCR